MPHPYADRRARLVTALAAPDPDAAQDDRALDALLVTDLVNVRYLCGFSGSNGALLVAPDLAVLATDGRYTEQAGAESPDVELLTTRALGADLAARAATLGLRNL